MYEIHTFYAFGVLLLAAMGEILTIKNFIRNDAYVIKIISLTKFLLYWKTRIGTGSPVKTLCSQGRGTGSAPVVEPRCQHDIRPKRNKHRLK